MGRLWRLAVLGLAFVMLDELGYGKCNAALDRDTYAEVVCGITDKGIVWRSFHSCAAAGMGVPTVSTFFRNGCKDLVIKSLPDVAKAKHLACKILEKMANECVSLYGANVSDWRVETGCTLTTPPLTTPKTATPTPISTTIKALSTAKPSECGKDVKADVLFVIDESRSVGPINFEKVKKFLADLVLQLPVAQDKIRVGVLSFTQIVHPRISLNEFDKPRDVADAILNMSYHGRRTNIAAALWYAQQTSFSKASGDRSTAPNLLFLFTDGRSRQRQISAAANATKAGIEIFTIGIGSNVSIPQITQLASEPKIDHVFTVAGFDALTTIKSTLGAKFCAVKAKKCNSDKEYQTNVTECQPTCPGAPQNCGDPTKMVPESCVCKPGTILDGTDCIKPASCVPKCWDNGNAYQVGDQLLIDNCKTEITCNLVNGKASLSKKAVSCSPPPSAECKTANGTRQCVCLPGYTGDGYSCLPKKTDPCKSYPCQNNGTCRPMGGPDFACICAPGYSGKFCHKRNPCPTNPCKNGGICKEDATKSKGFSCECKPHEPWTGELCDVDKCVSMGFTCKNGGSCMWNGGNGFICKCGPGYQGRDCGVDINECDSWPCWNGVCVDLVNGYKCNCDPGYTGVNCDQGP